MTWLALGAGGARRHGAPFGLVGRHDGGFVVPGHGDQSGAHGTAEVVECERWRGREVGETFSCCAHVRDKAG
jgi:hypothetical protein